MMNDPADIHASQNATSAAEQPMFSQTEVWFLIRKCHFVQKHNPEKNSDKYNWKGPAKPFPN